MAALEAIREGKTVAVLLASMRQADYCRSLLAHLGALPLEVSAVRFVSSRDAAERQTRGRTNALSLTDHNWFEQQWKQGNDG